MEQRISSAIFLPSIRNVWASLRTHSPNIWLSIQLFFCDLYLQGKFFICLKQRGVLDLRITHREFFSNCISHCHSSKSYFAILSSRAFLIFKMICFVWQALIEQTELVSVKNIFWIVSLIFWIVFWEKQNGNFFRKIKN